MISDFHFLRPLWLSALIPWGMLAFVLWHQKPQLKAWREICDPHLLAAMVQNTTRGARQRSLSWLFLSGLCVILSLSGPSWLRLPVPTFKPIQPRVLVLDMSESMLQNDLSPNRLTRAKFKIHDLLTRKEEGQFGMIVYTSEPFVVSPLTDDARTIDALLSMLTPNVLPVKGQKLELALTEAAQLIKNAGYHQGQILVLSADTPSSGAIQLASSLSKQGIATSIMPMIAATDINPLFARFASAGDGQVLQHAADTHVLESWLKRGNQQKIALNEQDTVPLWRDEGRWFLIPALFFLLPVFRRGWLQKVAL